MSDPSTSFLTAIGIEKLITFFGSHKDVHSFLPFLMGPITAIKENPVGFTKLGVAWTIAAGCIIALFYVINLQFTPVQVALDNLSTGYTVHSTSINNIDNRLRSVETRTNGLNFTDLITQIITLQQQLEGISTKLESNRKQFQAEYTRLWKLLNDTHTMRDAERSSLSNRQ